MSERIFLPVLLICFIAVGYAQADEVKMKNHSGVRAKAKNTGRVIKDDKAGDVISDPKAPAEFQEIDDLARDIKKTLAILQTDIEKIIAGIKTLAMRKSTIESEKQTIEMLTIQGEAKERSLTTLSGQIKDVSGQIDSFAELYRQKDGEFKHLSAELNELAIRRNGLSELRIVNASFKGSSGDAFALGPLSMPVRSEDIKSLHKRIDDILAGTVSVGTKEEKTAGVAGSINNAPKWVLDRIKAKGRKMETEYGDMLVTKDGGTTIICVRKENDVNFKSAYEKFIRETYEADGMTYFILASGSAGK